MKYYDIVIATASPRRRELIKKIKRVRPVFMTAEVEETLCSDAESTAVANARKKGEWAASRTQLPILAFDTVVGIDGSVLGKPADRDDAERMFEMLCGNTHEVVTAVYFRVGTKIIEKSEKTSVVFGAFDRETVYNYIESGAPYDKAGGYNIEDEEVATLIASVDGNRDNVAGLPIKLTEKLIEENLIYGENGYRD